MGERETCSQGEPPSQFIPGIVASDMVVARVTVLA